MHTEVQWLNDALATKEFIEGMTHYRIKDAQIRATNGRITASHPLPRWAGGELLIPGKEFERVLARMPDEYDMQLAENKESVTISAGRLRGKIRLLPLQEWDYPGVDDVAWMDFPEGLADLLKALRPFVSDNAVRPWSQVIAFNEGWACATNNVVVAGAPLPATMASQVNTGLPLWALDFIMPRLDKLTSWFWGDGFVAFKWENGAWLRSQLVEEQFPEKAVELVKDAWASELPYTITHDFEQAFMRVCDLGEGETVEIHHDKIKSIYRRAEIEEAVPCDMIDMDTPTSWTPQFLAPVIQAADTWDPGAWPKPCQFKGEHVAGCVVGRAH